MTSYYSYIVVWNRLYMTARLLRIFFKELSVHQEPIYPPPLLISSCFVRSSEHPFPRSRLLENEEPPRQHKPHPPLRRLCHRKNH